MLGSQDACARPHLVIASVGGPSYLPLGCDPDGNAAVVPPPLDTEGGVVGQLHLVGGVVEHVVDHPMVLDVFA